MEAGSGGRKRREEDRAIERYRSSSSRERLAPRTRTCVQHVDRNTCEQRCGFHGGWGRRRRRRSGRRRRREESESFERLVFAGRPGRRLFLRSRSTKRSGSLGIAVPRSGCEIPPARHTSRGRPSVERRRSARRGCRSKSVASLTDLTVAVSVDKSNEGSPNLIWCVNARFNSRLLWPIFAIYRPTIGHPRFRPILFVPRVRLSRAQ